MAGEKPTFSLTGAWRAINGSCRLKALTGALQKFQLSSYDDLKDALHAVRECSLIMLNPVYPLRRGEISSFLAAATLVQGQFDRAVECAAVKAVGRIGRSSRKAGEEALFALGSYSLGSRNDAVKAAAITALESIACKHGGELAGRIGTRLARFMEKDNYTIGGKTHDAVMKVLGSGLFAGYSARQNLLPALVH